MSKELRTIVVDACDHHRDVLVEHIRALGHEVMGLTSAGDLIQLYSRHQPHLVICEYDMDDMPAWKLAHQLLGMKFCPSDSNATRPYIVALSSKHSRAQKSLCEEVGVDVYATKPIQVSKVMQWVKNARTTAVNG